MDSGGSSGRLRRELGVPALGDLRRCILALASENPDVAALCTLFEYRFPDQGNLQGHSLGNLLLAAMVENAGGLQEGINEAKRLLGVRVGAVLPVTLQHCELEAVLKDGTALKGEHALDQRGASPIAVDTLYLRPSAQANPDSIRAIQQAEAIILGPGDLYTSLIPNLLVEGIAESIVSARGQRIVVGNLICKPGETDHYKLSDHLLEVLRYLGTKKPLDAVLIHDKDPSVVMPAGVEAVEPDLDACRSLARRILVRPVALVDEPGRHHPYQTAAALMEILQNNQD
jgi:uncharacterized cofD-like protein